MTNTILTEDGLTITTEAGEELNLETVLSAVSKVSIKDGKLKVSISGGTIKISARGSNG